jgi:hypothetical protein
MPVLSSNTPYTIVGSGPGSTAPTGATTGLYVVLQLIPNVVIDVGSGSLFSPAIYIGAGIL